MKLSHKLLLAPLLTATVLFTGWQASSWLLHREAAANRASFGEGFEQLRTLTSVQEQLGAAHAGVYRTVALMSSLGDDEVKAARAGLAKELGAIKRVTTALDGEADGAAELRNGVAQAGAQLDSYLKQADKAIDLSTVDPNSGIAAMRVANDTYVALAQTLHKMIAAMDARSSAQLTASSERTQRISLLLGLLGLAVAAIAVGLSWLTQRRAVAELQRAVGLAHAVAEGDLTRDAASTRGDEIGELLRALDAMRLKLAESMRNVQASSDSIRTASAEIATGNADLSSRTEQTASNLQQTASSMEQLTGTVKQSADSARQANQLASSAAEVAQRGGSVVSQVVSTMDEINASSKKISDIIGVIDGIAFQTNILALNAAVEAARAGEQGRGFAVVAGEVRNLAQRSAEAAKEIKSLIGASVGKVESGSKLVADAGATMGEIVASVKRVSDIIGEITAAAAEQSDGIGQVNSAVTQLDQMTQQNAALVEESAAAAESLKDQAQRLASTVATFRFAGATLAVEKTNPPSVAAAPAAAPAASRPVAPRSQPARSATPAPTPQSSAPTSDEWTTF